MSIATNIVLVVDDDADIREAVQDILSFEGYAVTQAANGQEALALLTGPNALRPCLILLDLMMPVMDGEEFVGRIQQEQRLTELPIILVTASGRGQVPGVRAVLKKPFDMDVLLSTVGEHRH
ncbi:two-component system response regulator [Myxococcus xanthus]|uniref:Two-component system response regulator n=1 Tax=Myxococcus xanthus TaxID=34 RepID=A0AAE6G6Q4_MYXXA|nr:response regulator [Myxococcus xanthus]QDE71957.1 two-component system response regulator [Myxococcus xanthus]QDE79239.1 two-component system response regulator [Myxococcus xanthus]